ncbi:8177_t:CDS:1, partial [Paraglomus brasilianum]
MVIPNILATQPVMVVLTDLKKTWFFYWLEEKKIHKLDCHDLKQVITIIESALTNGVPQHARKPDAPPFAKRVLMNVAIGCEPRGEVKVYSFEEMLERLRKRCNVEPPVIDDDIAPMHDMFDVMEPEEIRAWELRQWGQ